MRMHNLKYMYFFWKNYFTKLLLHVRTRSYNVAHRRTSPNAVGHGRASSHRYFARKLPYTVERSCTSDCTRSHSWPHAVEHGRTADRAQSHTVAQTTAHGRTKILQLSERPILVCTFRWYQRQFGGDFYYIIWESKLLHAVTCGKM